MQLHDFHAILFLKTVFGEVEEYQKILI